MENQHTELEASLSAEGRQGWVNRLSDAWEEQQKRDKVMREGREAALSLRKCVITGGLTNKIEL